MSHIERDLPDGSRCFTVWAESEHDARRQAGAAALRRSGYEFLGLDETAASSGGLLPFVARLPRSGDTTSRSAASPGVERLVVLFLILTAAGVVCLPQTVYATVVISAACIAIVGLAAVGIGSLMFGRRK